jgi:hypothetical protein
MSRRRSVARAAVAVAAAACAAVLSPAPVAHADPAGSLSASAGTVRATLSWSAGTIGTRRPRLTVVAGGTTVVPAVPVFASTCWQADCALLPSGRRPSALAVRDLDGDGEPEVLVDAFTLGAHCCALSEIFGRAPGGAWLARGVQWGNGGYDLRDLGRDGRLELVSSDDRFSARYTAYALSARPVRILRYAGAGRPLRVVTPSFPAAIRRDLAARRATLRRAQRDRIDGRGIVAAVVADLYLLRRPADARAQLDFSRRAGDLGGPRSATAFRRALLRDLTRWGYR